MEQPAQAAEDAAAVRAAARIAAARLTTTARLGGATTAGFSRGFAARLSGTAGLFGTTAAGFATAGLFAAAIIVPVEEVEQAAAVAAARITTTLRLTTATVAAKERRSAVGAAEHHEGAQDKRRKSKTSVHLETPKKQKREGEHTLGAPKVRTRRVAWRARGKCRHAARRRIAARAAHDVGNVIMRYRLRSPQTFTDRTNLPDQTKAPRAGDAL